MEEEDCPKTRIFSGFFGFPRFRVAQIRKRWNPCIAPSLVLTTLSCVRSTAVFPGFFQNFSRIIGSSRCDEQYTCRCDGHDGAPRLAPAIGRATPLRKMFQRDAISARRQMMVPVSQVALKPLMRCAVVETARARWHVALDQQCARPGPRHSHQPRPMGPLAPGGHDRRLSQVSTSTRLLLHRDRSSCIITEQKIRLRRMIEKGLSAR